MDIYKSGYYICNNFSYIPTGHMDMVDQIDANSQTTQKIVYSGLHIQFLIFLLKNQNFYLIISMLGSYFG